MIVSEQAQAKEIFIEAMEWPDEARSAFVNGACQGNPGLLARVDALLRAHTDAGVFLSSPTVADAAGPAAPPEGAPDRAPTVHSAAAWDDDGAAGTSIGPYKLLQKIGEGGFGVVYMAEQQAPVRRKVALKIIKLGMDTKQVIARFEAERQALAMMEHPNIARVLDAGATETGRPYFVMELVRGISITAYCDKNSMSTEERIALFMDVCHAVQHAHQKGIIHRDLKPSNVLVTLHDGTPVPKVIDFGIAKATHHRLTEKTLFTEFRQFVGTPEYMSPEQAEMSELDVDTRSDIYSLGVLLYELLTGTTPFDPQRLRSAAFGEIQRMILEEEPPRPSTRLSTVGDDVVAGLASKRRTNPERLSRRLRGDLDWIVMKALEKDRTRRYESASALGQDLQRHLDDEPVLAARPGTIYRLRKFVQRHRVAVGTSVALAAVLLLGIVGTTSMAVVALEQRETARQQVGIAEAINRFLNEDLLAQADPMREPDREITLRTVVDRAAAKIGARFESDPLVEAAIRMTLGRTYRGLGAYDAAEQQLLHAHRIRHSELGPDDLDTMRASRALAENYWQASRYEEAEAIDVPLLTRQRELLGDRHLETMATAHSLAITYKSQGRYDEAEPLLREVLETRERELGPEHPATLTAMSNFAALHKYRGEYDRAAELHAKALAGRRRALGDEHLDTVHSMSALALVYQLQGRYDDTEPLCRHVLDVRTRVLGETHPDTLAAINNLGYLYSLQGRLDETLPHYEHVLRVRRETLGDDHPHTLLSMNNLGLIYARLDRFEEAEPLLLEMLGGTGRRMGTTHPDYFRSLRSVGRLYEMQDRHEEAHGAYLRMMEGFRAVLAKDHPEIGTGLMLHGRCLARLDRLEEAEIALLEARTIIRKSLGKEHPSWREVNGELATLYAARGDPEQAAKHRRQAGEG